jgi:hypothetical protein
MKREIAKYVSECDTCQKVKASHLRASGTLQPLPIPSWKWEDISMDFIVGLPKTFQKHDSIWVIIDRLTKTAHFLPVHTTYSAKKYAEVYLDQIVRLHGVPKTIISDRGLIFSPCILLILPRSMPKSILIKLFDCMVSLRPLFLIEGPNSMHASGNNCSMLLEPNYFKALRIILRLMDKLSESTKLLKTCSELVLFTMVQAGQVSRLGRVFLQQ